VIPEIRPMRSACLVLALALSFAVTGCTRAAEDTAFGDKVRAYLLAHPEVIEEAVQRLQTQRDAQAAVKAKAALDANRGTLERDPRDFVANPNGKITVTEFYDYRCPHCINAAPKVLGIIHDNPDVRFVFKEMPIFGAVSEHAARAAIAVKAAGGDYVDFYRTVMTTKGLDDAAIDRIAKANGIDPGAAESGPARAKADSQIEDVHKLADALGVDGTPTFIIGDVVVPGEDMDAVGDAIRKARAGAKAG
jgi:protein-disulfide isomerase